MAHRFIVTVLMDSEGNPDGAIRVGTAVLEKTAREEARSHYLDVFEDVELSFAEDAA